MEYCRKKTKENTGKENEMLFFTLGMIIYMLYQFLFYIMIESEDTASFYWSILGSWIYFEIFKIGMSENIEKTGGDTSFFDENKYLLYSILVIFCNYLVKREEQKEKREQEIKDNTKLTKQKINFEKIKANLILNNYNSDLYDNLYNYIYWEFSRIIKYRTDVRRKIEDYYENTDIELYWWEGIYPDVGKIFGYILEQEEFCFLIYFCNKCLTSIHTFFKFLG